MCVCFGVCVTSCMLTFLQPASCDLFFLLLYASCEARVVTPGCSPPHVTNVSPVRTSSPVQTCAVKFSLSSPPTTHNCERHQPAQKTTTAHLSFLTFHPQRKKMEGKERRSCWFCWRSGKTERQVSPVRVWLLRDVKLTPW